MNLPSTYSVAMLTNIEIGMAFRAAREATGMSTRQVAAKSGNSFGHTALSRWETGKRAISICQADELAHIYGLQVRVKLVSC